MAAARSSVSPEELRQINVPAPTLKQEDNRKEPICFSPYLYRARNLVEQFFNKIKQCRRIATRYDRSATNFLAAVCLAATVSYWL